MIKLEKKKFREMEFDVVNLPLSEKVIDAYPKLSVYKEFTELEDPGKQLTLDKCLRFIILYYSKDSPIAKQTTEKIEHRTAECLYWIGITPKNKKYSQEVNDIIMNGLSKEFNMMVVRYMRYISDFKWTRLITTIDLYYTNLEKVTSGDGEKTIKAIDDLRKMEISIEEATKEIFDSPYTSQLIVDIDRLHQEEIGKISDWTVYYAKLRKKTKSE